MTATNEDLTKTVLTLSNVVAAILETQATLVEIVIPLARNLTADQQVTLQAALQDGRNAVTGLREIAKLLAES